VEVSIFKPTGVNFFVYLIPTSQLTHLLTPYSRVLHEKLIDSQLEKKFSAPEGSLPRSQEPVSGPYCESLDCGPHHHTVFL